MTRKCLTLFCLGLLLLTVSAAKAARIDTLSVESPKMKKNIEVLVIVPDQCKASAPCPTVYLLHGYGGNARSWLKLKPELPQMADADGIIVVCPYGENSWYWDSPLQTGSQFETFVSSELVNYIDSHYPTVADRRARAITGFSMGGHGGMWLSIRHKDIFGAGGSMSGGVDIRPFPDNWDMKKQLGEEAANQGRWDAHTAINQLDRVKDGDLAMIIDCGTEDFFYEVNLKFHQTLAERGIHHDFISRPGVHNEAYWNNSMDYQWLFFKKFFNGYRDTPVK